MELEQSAQGECALNACCGREGRQGGDRVLTELGGHSVRSWAVGGKEEIVLSVNWVRTEW